jgi:TetR/AcrR family transcriptional regulator, transcriptional repressor for nem operon
MISKKQAGKGLSKSKHARRHRVLLAARELFLLQGYAATTIDEICQRAGVTKGTVFYHFESKEVLALQLLERFIEEIIAPMAFARDPKASSDPLRRIELMLESFVRSYSSREPAGCLIGVFVSELAPVNEGFCRLCARAYGKMELAFHRELLAASFFHGSANPELDATEQAETLLSALQGALVLARAKGDSSVIERVARSSFKQLQTLFGTHQTHNTKKSRSKSK